MSSQSLEHVGVDADLEEWRRMPGRPPPARPVQTPRLPPCEDVEVAAVLLDAAQRTVRTETRVAACRVLADALKEIGGCETAAVALGAGVDCRLTAISHMAEFDANAEEVRRFEALCRRATEDAESHASSPTVDDGLTVTFAAVGLERKIIGACVLAFSPSAPPTNRCDVAAALVEYLGPVLETKLEALGRSRWTRMLDRLRRRYGERRRALYVATTAAIAVAMLPVPVRVSCDCELQPVVRRHVAAPFDGILRRNYCRPGDLVAAGQLLGRLDPEELTWELASVTADRDRAVKSRDVNLAAGKTAAAQIDRLEALRLDERRKLLNRRLEHLDITSPIDGVVVSGDLDRAEGAPVKLGATLYEVAPLDRMVVEALVPEDEIERVQTGQTTTVVLDSSAGRPRTGVVSRIYPRAEIRGDANVFPVEITLDEADGSLRPGMKGVAAVGGERVPLVWAATRKLLLTLYRLCW